MGHLKKRLEVCVVLISIVSILLLSSIFMLFHKTTAPSQPNYYGMALMGLIPSNEICQMQNHPELYEPTGVRTENYIIVKNKLTGETCLAK